MSLMDQIQRAWDAAVIAVNGHHSYENIPAPSLAQEFFRRLNQIHSSSIELIVSTLWSGYSSIKPSYNGLKMDCDKLKEERDELRKEHDQLQGLFDASVKLKRGDKEIWLKQRKEMIERIDSLTLQSSDLESSLNTSRYFIYLSGMCGFVLGLTCVYFVV